tara:strand:+ start:216 stop:446 length:231 start_codon:yes stop_codon:yes gene_type:complete
MENVEERVRKVVGEQFGIDAASIGLGHSFTEDIGGDSLELVELVMSVEEEFDVEIPAEEAELLMTVKSVIDWLNSH